MSQDTCPSCGTANQPGAHFCTRCGASLGTHLPNPWQKPSPGQAIGFGGAIKAGFANYVKFSGRATRSEYWWWVLFYVLVSITANIIGIALGGGDPHTPLARLPSDLVSLAFLLPSLSVAVRRLHDRDKSGWWVLGITVGWVLSVILLVAGAMASGLDSTGHFANGTPTGSGLAGMMLGLLFMLISSGASLVQFVWFCQRGTQGPNRFGPDPLSKW
jgi:uncharacterized membrane protein YhaH (DUF805 family)